MAVKPFILRPCRALIGALRALQRPLLQTSSLEAAGHAGLAAVGPDEDLGLFVGGCLQGAQRFGHGDHMHQRHAFFQLRVEHHRAGHRAHRAIGRLFEDGHEPCEVQQEPHDHTACGQGNAGPAKLAPGPDGEGDHRQWDKNFVEIHGIEGKSRSDNTQQMFPHSPLVLTC